ncbi:hypothetical protein [Paenibacillus piri]|uniref:Uncharacterized protein n=1 Tax=Paenibacillus piri TaxID=2547395 RepID=A0A4R5KI75_9BACL|nr:hypothetical protein [Paenibacillus piri]TDF95086.1 hypothetical protein E1757_21360 [Paenibacillus piri]
MSTGLLIFCYYTIKGISITAINENEKSLLLLVGSTCSMIGGYICARIAKKSEYFNAATIGVIGIAITSYSYVTGDISPDWYKSAALVVEIPITLLGVKLAKMRA